MERSVGTVGVGEFQHQPTRKVLPPEMYYHYAVQCSTGGKWHITEAKNVSTTKIARWHSRLVCQASTMWVAVGATTFGARSVLCPKCKRWLADRILRQDWS